ncbi:MAG: hypothetical protein JWQ27_1374 [Ferruginibacter sp.]|nr:hypothetical protein [Ferruginibacter sp.]
MKQHSLLLIAILTLGLLYSCKKESFISSADARLLTSVDTLKFDTVFTSTGSVTRSFKIINDNSQQLRLSEVKLMGGATSAFKININGIAVPQLNDVEIAANDSIYIFVSVTVNPTTANLPFIISDSIRISYNGNQRFVQLQAFGQNAVFLQNAVIHGNTTWTNTRPYVILGSLRVDTTAVLTIPAGTKIFAHANAPVIVDGSLLVNGTKAAPVIFTGDRLDEPYKDFPGSWPGIYFRGQSRDNNIRFAEIRNAYQAIVVQQPSVNGQPKLILRQSIIDNAYDAGLIGFNTSIRGENLLISNCSKNILIELGGNYQFSHCTAATYSNAYLLHKTPVAYISNATEVSSGNFVADLTASFTNCIFWGENGTVDNELQVNKQGNTIFSVTLTNCLYKAVADPANTVITGSLKNLPPMFDSIDVNHKYFNFHTSSATAPGINKGIATALLKDLDDANRNVGLPDLGCYEKQ